MVSSCGCYVVDCVDCGARTMVRRCAHCNVPSTPAHRLRLRCALCVLAVRQNPETIVQPHRYCSEACHAAHWPIHRQRCIGTWQKYHCAECGAVSAAALRCCAGCRVFRRDHPHWELPKPPYYCNRHCQKLHWRRTHKYTCYSRTFARMETAESEWSGSGTRAPTDDGSGSDSEISEWSQDQLVEESEESEHEQEDGGNSE